MNFNSILFFILSLLSLIFLIISIVFLEKYRKFQDHRLIKGVNSYLLGLVLLTIYILVRTLVYLKPLVNNSSFNSYVSSFTLGSGLFLVILINIFYLVSVILFKDTENMK